MTALISRSALLAAASLASAAAVLSLVPISTAAAGGPPPQVYCSSFMYNGQGSVDCTDNVSPASFVSWSYSGATSVYENTPIELGFSCTIGSAVSVTLHANGSASWSGTCA
jgi:hypothetical protein